MASTVPSSVPEIWLYTNEIPVWLQVLLGITACVAALLLATCLLLCCMRLCGCWSGNILGVGALRQMGPEAGDHFGCWCCRPPIVANSEGGHYVIQLRKDGTRR